MNDTIFNVSKAARVKQTHSSTCIIIDQPFGNDQWVEADAIITRTPHLPIGVITADCAPILLAGDGVIAAIHAGWQGALNHIIQNTIAKMDCDPATIQAFIGPCIDKKSYEVSKGFEHPFLSKDPKSKQCFTEKNADKLYFDLKAYCAAHLKNSGVTQINPSPIDTLTHLDYHSHRGGAGAKDRNLSAIMINC